MSNNREEKVAGIKRAIVEINIFAAPHKFYGPPMPLGVYEMKGDRWAKRVDPIEIHDRCGFPTGRYFP